MEEEAARKLAANIVNGVVGELTSLFPSLKTAIAALPVGDWPEALDTAIETVTDTLMTKVQAAGTEAVIDEPPLREFD